MKKAESSVFLRNKQLHTIITVHTPYIHISKNHIILTQKFLDFFMISHNSYIFLT